MKLGTFILGGLAGAAVVMMMRGRTMGAVTDGIGQMWKLRMNNMKENVLGKGMNLKFDGMSGLFSQSGSSNNRAGASASSGGLHQVEHLASKDPQVKKEVNEILHENGQQHL